MIHGLDTGFLVAAEMREHPQHAGARATLARLIGGGDLVGIAPQVLAEFIHVDTDARRFSQPQDMASARQSNGGLPAMSRRCSPATQRPANS
jgi:predicted nucleic acid-binding protein